MGVPKARWSIQQAPHASRYCISFAALRIDIKGNMSAPPTWPELTSSFRFPNACRSSLLPEPDQVVLVPPQARDLHAVTRRTARPAARQYGGIVRTAGLPAGASPFIRSCAYIT
jgi:hypothetical protein